MKRTTLGAAFATATLTVGLGATGASALPTTAADWEMNEPANSAVMQDSSGNGNDGSITQPNAELLTGQVVDSTGTGYTWTKHCPTCAPADPKRVIQVPDASDGSLEIPDPSVTYTLEFRFRTGHPFGNYMQKGQATSKGGQIKVQGPNGYVQCLFKDANGVRAGTTSKPLALDDGQWHTVQCVHTATQVLEYVDGVKVAAHNGSTGAINNNLPFTVGGKLYCDQITTTCDYFSGQMDWIRISHGS